MLGTPALNNIYLFMSHNVKKLSCLLKEGKYILKEIEILIEMGQKGQK